MDNSRWKTIQSWEHLKAFLTEHPEYFVHDTRDREKRFWVRSDTDKHGLSIDGRSVKALPMDMQRERVKRV